MRGCTFLVAEAAVDLESIWEICANLIEIFVANSDENYFAEFVSIF